MNFEQIFNIDDISGNEWRGSLVATLQERAEIADRLDLLEVKSLSATIVVRPIMGRRGLSVDGSLQAEIVQQCVVTLDPVEESVATDFSSRFLPPELIEDLESDEISYVGDEDPPEVLIDGELAVGSIVVEYLSLAIDPYPRKPGVSVSDVIKPLEGVEEGAANRENPFHVLKKQ